MKNQSMKWSAVEGLVVFTDPEFDAAIIGTTTDDRVVYNYDRMVEVLVERDGMTPSEAADFIGYNTIRALPYIENAPVVMYPVPGE